MQWFHCKWIIEIRGVVLQNLDLKSSESNIPKNRKINQEYRHS